MPLYGDRIIKPVTATTDDIAKKALAKATQVETSTANLVTPQDAIFLRLNFR